MTKNVPLLGAAIGAATFCLPVVLLLVLQLLSIGLSGVVFLLLTLIPAGFLGAFTGALSAVAAKRFLGLGTGGPSSSEWPTSRPRSTSRLRSVLSSIAVGVLIGAVAGILGFNGYTWLTMTPEDLSAGEYGRAVWWLSVTGSILGGAAGAGLGLVVGLVARLRTNQ